MRALAIGIVFAAFAATGGAAAARAAEAAPQEKTPDKAPPAAAEKPAKGEEAGAKGEQGLPQGVLARVNGNEVTVQDYVAYLFASLGRSKLREYIDRLLLEEEAKRLEVPPPTPEEVEEKVSALIESSLRTLFQNNQEKLVENLSRRGLTLEDHKAKLRQDTAYKLLEERAILKNRKVSAEEVQAAFDRTYGEGGTQYELRHISISVNRNRPQASGEEKRAPLSDHDARELAEKLVKEIEGGADFGQLAKTHSDDELTKRNEGRIPLYQKGYKGLEFDGAVSRLTEQSPLSGVVKTQQGYEIIQLLSKKTVKLEDKREEIVNQLKTRPPTAQERIQFIKSLREKAKIEM